MIGCACSCCAVYGPPPPRFDPDAFMADIEAFLATPEGQAVQRDLQREVLLDQGKRQLGQALSELLCEEP